MRVDPEPALNLDEIPAVCNPDEPLPRDESLDDMVRVLYDELHAVAQRVLSKERRGPTLQPTQLLHEAYLSLVGNDGFEDRSQFIMAATRAMRRLLIQRARHHSAQKRGGAVHRVTFRDIAVEVEDDQLDVIALDEAVSALEERDPRLAQVVNLRYFAGFTIKETAEFMNLSVATVKRDWLYARAWLFASIEGADRADG